MKTKEREEHWVPISLIEGEGFLTKADPVEGINSRTGGPQAVYEIHCELELHKDLKCSLNGEHWHSELFHSFQIQFLTACNHISEALQVLKITFLQNIISVSIITQRDQEKPEIHLKCPPHSREMNSRRYKM